ncbi:hypothetical protein LCGC14_1930140, partial [marine sediment metagenome]
QAETTQNVTVATQDGVDMKFNSAELLLTIDELSKRYIEPAVKVLVAGIEGDVLQAQTKLIPQYTGTAGTVVGASANLNAMEDRARVAAEDAALRQAVLKAYNHDGEKLTAAEIHNVKLTIDCLADILKEHGGAARPEGVDAVVEDQAQLCPLCGAPLHRVTYPGGYLNPDQWDDSIRAGDWYCDHPGCKGGRAGSRTTYRYFWNRDLAARPEGGDTE